MTRRHETLTTLRRMTEHVCCHYSADLWDVCGKTSNVSLVSTAWPSLGAVSVASISTMRQKEETGRVTHHTPFRQPLTVGSETQSIQCLLLECKRMWSWMKLISNIGWDSQRPLLLIYGVFIFSRMTIFISFSEQSVKLGSRSPQKIMCHFARFSFTVCNQQIISSSQTISGQIMIFSHYAAWVCRSNTKLVEIGAYAE